MCQHGISPSDQSEQSAVSYEVRFALESVLESLIFVPEWCAWNTCSGVGGRWGSKGWSPPIIFVLDTCVYTLIKKHSY